MNTIKDFVHPHLGIRLDSKYASIALILLALGVGVTVYSLNQHSNSDDAAFMMLGLGIVLTALAIVLYCFKGRTLYFLPTESKVERFSLHFDADQLPLLNELCTTGCIRTSQPLPPAKEIGNVRLDVLKATDNTFAAVQVLQYKDLMYEAQAPVRTLNAPEVEDLLKHINM